MPTLKIFIMHFDPESDSKIERILARRWSFLVIFFMVFFFTYLFLVAVDFVPEAPVITVTEQSDSLVAEEETPAMEEPVTIELEKPAQLYIKKLDKSIPVLNPVSREVEDLDNALISGAVRHPDSALLGQAGTVFILGHSSYLPQVYNRNFQAFNGIQDLEWGDIIEVTSEDNVVYTYRVDKAYRATADDATVVPIAGEEKRLVLATCNSFGSVDDRFIVEAVEISVSR
jgi:LPXTG-site transpeptidase (sortase) family protein